MNPVRLSHLPAGKFWCGKTLWRTIWDSQTGFMYEYVGDESHSPILSDTEPFDQLS